MIKILHYMKEYKKECILSPFFKLLEATIELFVPLVIAAIIDKGVFERNITYIYQMVAVLIFLGIVGLFFSITAQYFAAKSSVLFATKLRNELFSKVQEFSYETIDEIGTGTLITRITSDVNQVQAGVNLTLRLLLRSPFIVIGAFLMALSINRTAAIILGCIVLVLALLIFLIMVISIPLYQTVQKKLDVILQAIRENIQGIRVIRGFCKEQHEMEQFEGKNQQLQKSQLFVGKISALLNPLTYVVINIGIVLLLWTGAIKIDQGILSQGLVIALYNYMAQILEELVKLANMIINLTKAIACGNRIQDIFMLKKSMTEGTEEFQKSEEEDFIEFKHVSFRYSTASKEVLKDLNFKVKRGQTVGIIGGTGSGKTTLINLIPRFYDATSGTILINGKVIKEYRTKSIRDQIGIVPQKAVLFTGSLEENIKWGKQDATKEEVVEAITVARGLEVLEKRVDGMELQISQNGKNLSGGQRQRMTIARALIRKPQILILDDSSSALDYKTDLALREELKKLEYRPTIFQVSQRTSSIQHADLILVLDEGKIVGSGNHEQLLNKCAVYREIFRSQEN